MPLKVKFWMALVTIGHRWSPLVTVQNKQMRGSRPRFKASRGGQSNRPASKACFCHEHVAASLQS